MKVVRLSALRTGRLYRSQLGKLVHGFGFRTQFFWIRSTSVNHSVTPFGLFAIETCLTSGERNLILEDYACCDNVFHTCCWWRWTEIRRAEKFWGFTRRTPPSPPLNVCEQKFPIFLQYCDIGLFQGVKQPGGAFHHPPPSSFEVEGRVEVCLYSASVPAWEVIGWTLLST
jgi:hypothetical protein